MFFANYGYRNTTFPEFDRAFDFRPVAAVQLLFVTDASYNQVVHLLAYPGSDQAATLYD